MRTHALRTSCRYVTYLGYDWNSTATDVRWNELLQAKPAAAPPLRAPCLCA
jgi:hypothetical protein